MKFIASHASASTNDNLWDLTMALFSNNAWDRQSLALETKVPHDLEAQAESAVLVTIAWPGDKRS
jgi:hypothetical protein